MPQEHERALGAWRAELAEWPRLVMSTHGGARALVGALPHLRVNLDAIRATLPKGAADEWFDPALAQHAGELALAQLAGWRSQ